MRLSARHQFKGKVVEVKKGVTTTHVRVDIGGGHVVTASITTSPPRNAASRTVKTPPSSSRPAI